MIYIDLGRGLKQASSQFRSAGVITYGYSIKVSVIEMAKEKINKSTVVIRKVFEPIKILTIIKFCQLLLEICTTLDTCMANNRQIAVV